MSGRQLRHVTGNADGDEFRAIWRAATERGHVDRSTRAVIFHDLDAMTARISQLEDAFPSSTLHALAIKANPLVELLRVAVAQGVGLEAASIEEVEVALLAGCAPDRIVFDSPAKTTDELRRALDLGVVLNADNTDELRRIAQLEPERSGAVVSLRVNPLVGPGRISTTSVAGGNSRFGLPADEASAWMPTFAAEHPWLRGVHVHVGSQGTSLPQLTRAASVAAEVRSVVNRAVGSNQIEVVDIGGGLPAVYGPDDVAITPSDYAAELRDVTPTLFEPDVRLVTEFGRSIHANCAWAASRVEYTKEVASEAVVVTHLGADLLLRVAYQPEHWHHRFSAMSPHGEPLLGNRRPYTVAGPLCFAGDVIGRDVPLPALTSGDILVIHDVGAYTVSMWSRHCSRGIPLILGYRRDEHDQLVFSTLRPAESPEDVARFWSADPGGAVR